MDKDSFTLGVQASGPLARARLEATALVCPKGWAQKKCAAPAAQYWPHTAWASCVSCL